MTKTLVIIRHGKSTWDYGPIADMDRPLKENGISNTILISQKIKEREIVPDLIISSPAIRALSTALIVARELNYPPEKIVIDSGIYGDSEEEILEIIHSTNDSVNKLFLFGHNPAFTFLPNHFLTKQIENLPTSGTAIFEFQTEKWSEISKMNLISETCIFPKQLLTE
jgi:phosphohistidine phosphatase